MLYDSLVYQKGASVMRQLEYRLRNQGKDLLKLSIQQYMERFKFANADLNDFFQILKDIGKVE